MTFQCFETSKHRDSSLDAIKGRGSTRSDDFLSSDWPLAQQLTQGSRVIIFVVIIIGDFFTVIKNLYNDDTKKKCCSNMIQKQEPMARVHSPAMQSYVDYDRTTIEVIFTLSFEMAKRRNGVMTVVLASTVLKRNMHVNPNISPLLLPSPAAAAARHRRPRRGVCVEELVPASHRTFFFFHR